MSNYIRDATSGGRWGKVLLASTADYGICAWHEQVCEAVAAAIGTVLSFLQPRRTTIHVTDVSEEWLSDHATETPKHAEQH